MSKRKPSKHDIVSIVLIIFGLYMMIPKPLDTVFCIFIIIFGLIIGMIEGKTDYKKLVSRIITTLLIVGGLFLIFPSIVKAEPCEPDGYIVTYTTNAPNSEPIEIDVGNVNGMYLEDCKPDTIYYFTIQAYCFANGDKLFSGHTPIKMVYVNGKPITLPVNNSNIKMK